ncbi:hypothetical protein J40TS1_21010 [Paenibacillus montaniterrae]|uniref:Uncharacterized protein n=1 Tax=Paenibacillus montaniterrae TaxID=429341 RepID=A0A919YQN3_9BACL|nr:hypothetical protein J40TS1_21010 [Paenibacillus montaniterrae]
MPEIIRLAATRIKMSFVLKLYRLRLSLLIISSMKATSTKVSPYIMAHAKKLKQYNYALHIGIVEDTHLIL